MEVAKGILDVYSIQKEVDLDCIRGDNVLNGPSRYEMR